MWNQDPARRSLSPSGNFPPRNFFAPNPRQLPPPLANFNYPPPHPFFRNTFSPVCGVSQQKDNIPLHLLRSTNIDHQSSYPFEKRYAAERSDDDTSVSSPTVLHMPYSPGRNTPQGQGISPSLSPEQYTRSGYPKSEVIIDRFSHNNSTPPQSRFLSESKSFGGGIPFISDATADVHNSPSFSNYANPVSSATKQEEDSLEYFYNRCAPGEENHESTPTHSFEKGNSSLDHSVFSQKSNDSYLSEGSRCGMDADDDSQSRLSIPGISASPNMQKRKAFTTVFSEDSHPASAGSVENSAKRHKLHHTSSHMTSETEMHISEVSDPDFVGPVENLAKQQVSYHVSSHLTSELEKHISEVSDPVVGLDYIMEFQKDSVPPILYTYKCTLCNTSILAKHVLMHIIGVKHRLKFLKTKDESKHQKIMKLHTNQEELAGMVTEAVDELEGEFGRGSVKVVADTTSEAKNNEEKKNVEESFSISPEISTSSILPCRDSPLLDKIPEPPDLKLLNDILSTAQSLQTGNSKEFFHFPSKIRNEEQQEAKTLPYDDHTVSTKWPLECEIPPPPPLSFAEGSTSPWSHHSSPLQTSSPSPTVKTPCDVNSFSIVTSQLTSALSAGDATKSEASQKNMSPIEESNIFGTDLSESPVENQNSEVRHPSSSELMDQTSSPHLSPDSSLPENGDSKSKQSFSVLKSELFPDCKSEVLPKIPLIGDSACDAPNGVVDEIPKSPDASGLSKILPFINGLPNQNAPCAELTEQQVEMGKAAIYESLSRCTVTNEAEADFVKGMITLLRKVYLRYLLRNMPPNESESLSQALLCGDKDGIKKLESFLNEHHTTGNGLAENSGNNPNVYKKPEDYQDQLDFDICTNELSSSLNPVKNGGSEDVKTAKSYSSSAYSAVQEEDVKSVTASLASQGGNQQLNVKSFALDSLPAVSDDKSKLNDSKESTVDLLDTKSANSISVNEVGNKKCSGDYTLQVDKEYPSNTLKFPLLAPPPPPPPPPESVSQAAPASQVAMPEQQNYTQPSESSVQMTSYGGWPMAFYPGASQAAGYMYWPAQNMAGMDPSVMNTQFMIPAQNQETGIYSWCTQPTTSSQGSSHLPPLPPPPPPPPPPPTSSAP